MKEYMKTWDSNDYESIQKQDKVSVLVFSANWCPDCVFIEPFMKSLCEKYSAYDFYYIDRDENIELCQYLMVMGIPSFVAIGKGKELGRFVSKLRKSESEIDAFLASLK